MLERHVELARGARSRASEDPASLISVKTEWCPSFLQNPLIKSGRLQCSAALCYPAVFMDLLSGMFMGVHATMDQLKEIMRDVFDDDSIDPTEAMTAQDVEGWDSLSHIRLMVSIEKQFHVKFTNAEVEQLRNVGDLLKAINSKV
jgi:acyl carrier protein